LQKHADVAGTDDELAVRFTNHSGRYMYHCHILEHEDRDMMPPFVTTPMELMPFMVTS
jgi:spore coat protein A